MLITKKKIDVVVQIQKYTNTFMMFQTLAPSSGNFCFIFFFIFQVIEEDRHLETSTLGLRFKVRDKHFKHGDLKLKCTAAIATIYWKSNEESVQGVRPQSALVSESRSSRNSGN